MKEKYSNRFFFSYTYNDYHWIRYDSFRQCEREEDIYLFLSHTHIGGKNRNEFEGNRCGCETKQDGLNIFPLLKFQRSKLSELWAVTNEFIQ